MISRALTKFYDWRFHPALWQSIKADFKNSGSWSLAELKHKG